MLKKIVIKSLEDLKVHVQNGVPAFYFSSQTSTVIPYDKIEKYLETNSEYHMCDLSQMPKSMDLLENGNLIVRGAVNWKDAREYLRPKGRNIKTGPTEELALITAGAATSCTGERCFHFGNLRSQIKRIKYVNFEGIELELHSDKKIDFSSNNLEKYQSDFSHYNEYKNAPYPRFETQTDLMIGTEGQLGIITEIEIETAEDFQVNHLFMLIPKWEVDPKAHLEIIKKVQSFREEIILCELIDANAFSFLADEDQPNKGQDAIFFEIKSDEFENIYEKFIMDLAYVEEENIFELTESKFHTMRASIPRAVFEENSRMGVTKMGTDVQVSIENFPKLLEIYKEFSNLGVRYNLFGHFGDAHLHFNFMPSNEDMENCQKEFERMYAEVVKLQGSPFAEHGIGLIKQKYIKEFWNKNQTNLFSELKEKYDPKNQFFPQGYMNLK
jgi:FAD/FMN-containing dehydrogenase